MMLRWSDIKPGEVVVDGEHGELLKLENRPNRRSVKVEMTCGVYKIIEAHKHQSLRLVDVAIFAKERLAHIYAARQDVRNAMRREAHRLLYAAKMKEDTLTRQYEQWLPSTVHGKTLHIGIVGILDRLGLPVHETVE